MSTQKIEKKIDALKDKIEKFISNDDGEMESIHKIRTSSREVLSLLNEQKLHCVDLKKILKLSNKIRDIDVLLNEYFIRIPQNYHDQINILFIKDILKEERNKELLVFLDYLRNFAIENIEFLQKEQNSNKESQKPILSSNKKELHKYRIFIKNQLYIAKNCEPINKDKVILLTKIKDLLGDINDNYNAIKIIKSINPNKKDIKELKRYTKEENLLNYKAVESFILELEYKYI